MKSHWIFALATIAFSIGFVSPSAWAEEAAKEAQDDAAKNYDIRVEFRGLGSQSSTTSLSSPDLSNTLGGIQGGAHVDYHFRNGTHLSLDGATGAVTSLAHSDPDSNTWIRNLQVGSRFLRSPVQIEAKARLVDETASAGIGALQAGPRFNYKGGHTSVLAQGGYYWDRADHKIGYMGGLAAESELTPIDALTLRAAVEAGVITGQDINLGVAGRAVAGVRANFDLKKQPSFIELRGIYDQAGYKDMGGQDIERSALTGMIVIGISEGASSANDRN